MQAVYTPLPLASNRQTWTTRTLSIYNIVCLLMVLGCLPSIMPKTNRAASHSHRSDPVPVAMAESAPNGTRVTSTWSADNDQTLLDARASGMNWPPIAQRHFPTKTANACRKRHERLIERRNAENWGGINTERLASQYMLFRAEIWKPLADRLGEKWQVIEAKVCPDCSFSPLHHDTKTKPSV